MCKSHRVLRCIQALAVGVAVVMTRGEVRASHAKHLWSDVLGAGLAEVGAEHETPVPSPTPLEPVLPKPVIVPRVPLTTPSNIQSTQVFSLHVVPPPVGIVRQPPATLNIALLGVDSRGGVSGNTDVLIVASVQPDIPAVTLLSIPRDTLVYIPGRRMAKVNTAFSLGPEVFRQTMRYNFGLRIDAYVAVNFTGVVRTVNLLGGIEIVALCPVYQVFPRDPFYLADPEQPNIVTRPYTDTFTGRAWEVGQPVPTMTISLPRPGVYKLDGLRALAYARARYGIRGGDVDRGRRTQDVLRAMWQKARTDGLLTLARAPQIYQQLQRYVRTDLSLSQILWLAGIANSLELGAIRSRYFDGVGLTAMTLPEVGAVLVPNRERIQPFLEQALSVSPNQVVGDGIQIEVWNGHTRSDFDRVAVARLRELGFSVVSVERVDQVYTQTQVVDFTTTSKGSALPLLKRSLGVKDENVTTYPRADGPRYRVIVGNDFVSCYRDNYTFFQQAPSPAITPTPSPDATPAPPTGEQPLQDLPDDQFDAL